MLTLFIEQNLKRAQYKILDDGSFYGNIPGLKGVWANTKTLSSCQSELRSVLEGWLVLKLRDGDKIPGFVLKQKTFSTKIQYA